MISFGKLDKPYEQITIRTKVWYVCDYCGNEFLRDKKSREKLNAIIDKDSCGVKECKLKKLEDVFEKKYGNKNIFATEEFKQKQKQTNIEKYGTEEYFQSEDFKSKREETLMERYGVKNPLQNEEIRLKQENTCEKVHGVRNYSQHEDFVSKVNKTSRDNYGVDFPMQSKEVQETKDETSIKKYGVKNYTQTEQYWIDRKEKCLKEKGVEHESQLPEIREKAKQTCMERYGVDSFSKTEEFLKKTKNTNLEKFGVENYSQTEEYKQRRIKTCQERYGVDHPFQAEEIRIKIEKTLIERYGSTNPAMKLKEQNEIKNWLNSFGFSFDTDRKILDGKEIDLLDTNLNIGIEYCGLYWHNEYSPQPRLYSYHYDKYLKCKEKGIKLLTIFEDEWLKNKEKCKSVIKSIVGIYENKIYARETKLVKVNKEIKKEFLNENHLFNNDKSNVCFGLVHSNHGLVAVCTLGKHPRINDEKLLILRRLCFKKDFQVVGGAGKLFAACKKWGIDNNYEKIITWSDNRWSSGKIYEILGFNVESILPPDRSYVDIKRPVVRYSKQSIKKENTYCPENKTEKEWATEHGLARIWDCGKIRWIYVLV